MGASPEPVLLRKGKKTLDKIEFWGVLGVELPWPVTDTTFPNPGNAIFKANNRTMELIQAVQDGAGQREVQPSPKHSNCTEINTHTPKFDRNRHPDTKTVQK